MRGGVIVGSLVFLVLAAIVAVPVWVAWRALDDKPVVIEAKSLQADDVQRARILAKRTIESVLAADEPVVVALSENELNGLVAMASRGVPELTGRINVTEWGLEGALSYRLPDNPLGRFVNLRGGLEASSHGIYINRLALGRIEVPGPLALRTARTAADILLGDDQGTLLLAAVEKVTLDQGAG